MSIIKITATIDTKIEEKSPSLNNFIFLEINNKNYFRSPAHNAVNFLKKDVQEEDYLSKIYYHFLKEITLIFPLREIIIFQRILRSKKEESFYLYPIDENGKEIKLECKYKVNQLKDKADLCFTINSDEQYLSVWVDNDFIKNTSKVFASKKDKAAFLSYYKTLESF